MIKKTTEEVKETILWQRDAKSKLENQRDEIVELLELNTNKELRTTDYENFAKDVIDWLVEKGSLQKTTKQEKETILWHEDEIAKLKEKIIKKLNKLRYYAEMTDIDILNRSIKIVEEA